ncbi:MAG: hypothetical protein PHG60_02240 [Candidatus Dojkabacteria bacterium]|jgi:hypothetical protein|nr:hypothetical protein [Candidatus Dojkabacteria bacterium]MDD2270376.1 hypothetical protein [Candidatus Dojkabacteria bacterium]
MKLPKYILIPISLVLLSLNFVFAQVYQGSVVVNATINEDTFSTLEVLPNSVEIMERAIVIVTIRDNNLNPLSGHYIRLIAPGVTFTQPTQPSNSQGKIFVQVYSDQSGAYTISAQDITDLNLTIDILDRDTLYVHPLDAPFLLEEPKYTRGTTNTVFWNSLGSGYKYYTEVSRYADFSSIKSTSGWIDGTKFEFDNLENGVMYFYRVKARNSYGGESIWSNVRYSVQDNEPPVITFLSISSIGENNSREWESGYKIEIVYKIEDNLFVKDSNFYCVKQNGTRVKCGTTVVNGSVYTTTITLANLEKKSINDLFPIYSFCIDAQDGAGNSSEICDINLEVPPWQSPIPPEPEPEPKPEPPKEIPTYIGRIVKDFIDQTQIAMDNMFGNLDDLQLQDITTTTTIATITISIGGLLGGLFYIPIYLFQLLLGFLSWLGLRKRGQRVGYVYDSKSKDPISQAVIRVYSLEKRLVWTDVTDSRGMFRLGLDDGEYMMSVAARGYEFPSTLIFGKSDYPLENVYHGGKFTVTQKIVPEFSIPMDATEMSWFSKFVTTVSGRFRVLYKVLSILFFVFGLLFSIYTYSINSNWFNFIIILLYIPSFVLVIRVVFKKEIEYGVVKDSEGNPLEGVAVGLKDKEFRRIVAKRYTDGKGRYRFIVDKGDYSLEILETGYEVVEIEEKEARILSNGSMLIALDTVVKQIDVEN